MAVKYLLIHRLASVSKPASEHSTSIDGIRLKCGDFHLYIALPYGLYTSTLINSSCSIHKMIKAVIACAMFDFPRYASHWMHRKKIYIFFKQSLIKWYSLSPFVSCLKCSCFRSPLRKFKCYPLGPCKSLHFI